MYSADVPPVIRFGIGVRRSLMELLPAQGALLIVCGRHAGKRIETELAPLFSARRVEVICVPPEIPLASVENGVALARKIQAAAVVGWGGGSAMDAAKAIAALISSPLPAAEYFYNRAQASRRSTPLFLLPTTAGTGAEITANAVLLDEKTGIKQSLRTPGMTADAALIDPELLAGAPASVMAASGFDALTQALEGFVSRKADAVTKQMSLAAASLLLRNLERGCKSGDRDALEALARGSMLAGIAFAASGLGAVHGIGHPLGSVLHLAHGLCCATLLVPVMQYNCAGCRAVFAELAAGLGFSSPEALIDEVMQLRFRLGLPQNFRKFGLKREHFPFIVAHCRSGSMRCNPREFTDADVEALLEGML